MLWEQNEYDSPLSRVFFGRSARLQFAKATAQERYLCTVVVREWFGGRPWIEVERAVQTRQHVSEGVILAVIRATELVERGAYTLALGEFDRALLTPLPAITAKRLGEARQACARRAGLGPVRAVEAKLKSK